MDKEEAKKLLRDRGEKVLWGADTSNYRKFMNDLDDTIDAIEVEHKPVVLPQKVGKQWTKLVSHYWSSHCSASTSSKEFQARSWSKQASVSKGLITAVSAAGG